MSKKWNKERAKWRARCRQKLAEHIGEKLGCPFGPMDVRLITGPDVPYVWVYPQERESLFRKQLSKHTMRAYVELIGEVGKTIHAVPVSADKTVGVGAGAASRASDVNADGTIRIQQLEDRCSLLGREHARAIEQSIQWQLQAAESLQLKSSAEVELAIVGAELRSAQDVIQELRCQLAALSSTVHGSLVLGAPSKHGLEKNPRAVAEGQAWNGPRC